MPWNIRSSFVSTWDRIGIESNVELGLFNRVRECIMGEEYLQPEVVEVIISGLSALELKYLYEWLCRRVFLKLGN